MGGTKVVGGTKAPHMKKGSAKAMPAMKGDMKKGPVKK